MSCSRARRSCLSAADRRWFKVTIICPRRAQARRSHTKAGQLGRSTARARLSAQPFCSSHATVAFTERWVCSKEKACLPPSWSTKAKQALCSDSKLAMAVGGALRELGVLADGAGRFLLRAFWAAKLLCDASIVYRLHLRGFLLFPCFAGCISGYTVALGWGRVSPPRVFRICRRRARRTQSKGTR